jgi:hypothetical protein
LMTLLRVKSNSSIFSSILSSSSSCSFPPKLILVFLVCFQSESTDWDLEESFLCLEGLAPPLLFSCCYTTSSYTGGGGTTTFIVSSLDQVTGISLIVASTLYGFSLTTLSHLASLNSSSSELYILNLNSSSSIASFNPIFDFLISTFTS